MSPYCKTKQALTHSHKLFVHPSSGGSTDCIFEGEKSAYGVNLTNVRLILYYDFEFSYSFSSLM